MRASLQGACFGFSMYCFLVTTFPDHGLLQRYSDPVACAHYLQRLYDQNRKNEDVIIRLDGIEEWQDTPLLVALSKRDSAVVGTAKKARVDSVWELDFPETMDLERGFILCFAVNGGDDGHAIFVSPGIVGGDAMICDTADLALQEIFDKGQLREKISQRVGVFFAERHPDLSEGTMLMQSVWYENITILDG
jgi:hypothetical protein